MYTLRSGFALETINYLERVLQNLDIIGSLQVLNSQPPSM